MQCPSCASQETIFGGLQWFPLRVFEAQRLVPTVQNADRPDEGALRMFTCEHCHTSFIEEALPAIVSTSGD
ncbi:MAG: hypothetical protein CUN55_00210 [Phototrophicales bacterium]|nr:MAG: hypothetical protein CUN55_00210 [Phototrophicales bacterium]